MSQEERIITVTNADRVAIVQALKNYLADVDLDDDAARQDYEHVETLIKKFND